MTTTAQATFISNLRASRVVPANLNQSVEALSTFEASKLIDSLKACAYKTSPTAAPAPVADRGYYFVDGEVYTVVAAKIDKSKSYAKILVNLGGRGKWEYVRGMVMRLTPANRITVAQAKEFGHLHGFCMVCGKALTDPKSVENGIGPVCIKKV